MPCRDRHRAKKNEDVSTKPVGLSVHYIVVAVCRESTECHPTIRTANVLDNLLLSEYVIMDGCDKLYGVFSASSNLSLVVI